MHFILRGRTEGTNETFLRNGLRYIGTFDYAISNANFVPSHFQIRSLRVWSVSDIRPTRYSDRKRDEGGSLI